MFASLVAFGNRATQSRDGRIRTIPAPFAVPSIAAESGSKARLSEHTDVRVRAGPLAARSAGHSDSLDVNQNAAAGA